MCGGLPVSIGLELCLDCCTLRVTPGDCMAYCDTIGIFDNGKGLRGATENVLSLIKFVNYLNYVNSMLISLSNCLNCDKGVVIPLPSLFVFITTFPAEFTLLVKAFSS